MKINKHLEIKIIYSFIIISTIMSMFNSYMQTSTSRRIYIATKTVLMGLCILYLATMIIKSKKIYISDLIIIIFAIYELIIAKINGLLIFPEAYNDILIWPSIFLIFKDYASEYDLPNFIVKLTKKSFYIMSIISIFLIAKHLSGQGNVGGVIFPIYNLLTFLPLVMFMCKNKKEESKYVLITASLLLLSTKRASFIAISIGYIAYLFSTTKITAKSIYERIKKYYIYIIGIFMLITVLLIVNSVFNLKIFERFNQIKFDEGSGRIIIWKYVLNDYNNSSSNVKKYGHGFQSVYYNLKPFNVDRLAHNSFIEFLYDYGYVGLSIFIIFILYIIRQNRKLIKKNHRISPYMTFSTLIAIILGSVSYFFEESAIILPIATMWGISISQLVSNKKESKQNYE